MAQVVWTLAWKDALKTIWEFYAEVDARLADKIIDEIIETAEGIEFAQQFQIEEILGQDYRRAIVRHFKIIYAINGDVIRVLDIFDSRQNPSKLNKG